MNRRDLFSRKIEDTIAFEKISKEKHEIICENPLIEYCIINWARNMGWSFRNVGDFFEMVRVKTPVKASDFDTKERSFKCLTAQGNEIKVYILFDEMHVVENGEKRKYKINYNVKKGVMVPKVTRIE